MTFKKVKEDFTCLNCSAKIKGNGYTNHCSQCLYSLHLDNEPGDRACSCRGLMKPIALELRAGRYTIIHRCLKCGEQKRNKTAPNDILDSFWENML